MSVIYKDPQAVADYTIDWSAIFGLGNDHIITSTWFVPDGLVKVTDSIDDESTSIRLCSGTLGSLYKVRNKVQTNGDRIDYRTLYIKVANK